jgi:hypothetical protein
LIKKKRRRKYYILQLSLEIKKFLQMACKLKFERYSQGSVLLNLWGNLKKGETFASLLNIHGGDTDTSSLRMPLMIFKETNHGPC